MHASSVARGALLERARGELQVRTRWPSLLALGLLAPVGLAVLVALDPGVLRGWTSQLADHIAPTAAAGARIMMNWLDDARNKVSKPGAPAPNTTKNTRKM